MKDNGFTKKVAIVGTGFVGMSFAYAMLCDGTCDELVLIDINKTKADGEAMDLNHGLAFAKTNMKIYSGEYKDCADADIVVICAGVSQKPGEDRISLLQRNREVFKSIISPILYSGFSGIFLVATNPVDIMTRVVWQLSGFDCRKVIGSGTTLDTARLRYLLGEHFGVDPKNVHAYVIGEHGDSEIAAWSSSNVSGIPLNDFCEMRGHFDHASAMKEIAEKVKTSAYEIIAKKQATYYGIAMSVKRICEVIVRNERSILPVSTMMHGEYGIEDVCLSVLTIVDRNGVRGKIMNALTEDEVAKLHNSANRLKEVISNIE